MSRQLTPHPSHDIMQIGKGKAMEKLESFAKVLEAADELSLVEQENLAEILHRRVIERRRAQLAREVHEARQEFETGGCPPVTTDDLMSEILS